MILINEASNSDGTAKLRKQDIKTRKLIVTDEFLDSMK